MIYSDLKDILLSSNVYKLIKENETEIFSLIPELSICKGFEQNNKWHIYDVYNHILHVISEVEPNIYLRISALFHDIGKPFVYIEDNEGVGHFYNHWNVSVEIFKKYQNNFGLTEPEKQLIINLIFYHDISIEKMTEDEINKMLKIFGKDNIKLLFNLKRSDLLAQSPNYHYLLDKINNQEQSINGKVN